MAESIRDLILSFDRSGKAPGKMVATICKNNAFEDIENVIAELISSRDYETFEKALDFLAFLWDSTSYIPGIHDDGFVKYLGSTGTLAMHLFDILEQGNYARAIHILEDIRHLPLVVTAERYQRLVRATIERTPLLMKDVINFHMEGVDRAFPFAIFELLDFEQRFAAALAQYNVAEYSEADTTAKVEMYEAMNTAFPEFASVFKPRLAHWRGLNERLDIGDNGHDSSARNIAGRTETSAETGTSPDPQSNIFDKAIFEYFEASVDAMSRGEEDPDYFEFVEDFEENE